jgi:uncharacterized cofD-like protein
MSTIRAIIFDLDNTLFDTEGQLTEKQLKKAVQAMIDNGLRCSLDEGLQTLKRMSQEDWGNKKIFADLSQHYNGTTSLDSVGKETYYTFTPEGISLFPGVKDVLERLRQEYMLILVTFGHPETQNLKIANLGLEHFFHKIITTANVNKEESFLDVIDSIGVRQKRILAVGDRIDSELKVANKLGLTTVRVLHGKYQHLVPADDLEKPDYTIHNITELTAVLENIKVTEDKLSKGPAITLLGAGTGVPALIEGLKKYTHNIASIVNIIDAGRSSGILRKELGMPPPGDIRNNIIALSDSEKLLHDLFQYRFEEGSLKGHCFGNLFIAAMTKVTGNFQNAIIEVSKILNIKGSVHPASLEDTQLGAILEDGTVLHGEQEVVVKGEKIKGVKRSPIKEVFLEPADAKGNPSALRHIRDADIIIIGPGSLMSSVLPNIINKDINKALKETKAKIVYVCNIMTQPGQTEGFTASNHVKFLMKYLGAGVIDYMIINNEIPPNKVLKQYEDDNSFMVENDLDEIRRLGIKPIVADLVEDLVERKVLWSKVSLLRHDSNKIAETIMHLIKTEDIKTSTQYAW